MIRNEVPAHRQGRSHRGAWRDHVNLATIFSGKEMLYVDYSRVIPQGNERVAAALVKSLR